MISAISFQKAIKAQASAKQQVLAEMPEAIFALQSVDDYCIYFGVLALCKETSDQQIRNLKEKTRFALLGETNSGIYYSALFKMYLH